MLDIGFLEIIVIGALALIVVGPKDLPGLLRTVGQYVGKARSMASEFQRTMEDAAREADLGDVADVVKGKGNLKNNSVVDSLKEFERSVKTEVNDAARAADTAVKGPSAPAPEKTPADKAQEATARVAANATSSSPPSTSPSSSAAPSAVAEAPKPVVEPAKPADPAAKSA